MSSLKLLYANEYAVNDKIKVLIPKVGDVIDNEDTYYNLVSMITAAPYDMMAELDDIGIDFTQINSWELFILLFPILQQQDTSLIFGDLDLKNFELSTNPQNGNAILIDVDNGITIDRAIQNQIAAALRKIHHLEKNNKQPANDEAKRYLLERARMKRKRNSKRVVDSQLESLVIALVNTEQYKYDYEGTRELSIYQFNESVKQIVHKIAYDQRMSGVFAGTVDAKALSQDDLNWLKHK